jgi:hypothetical protein
VASLRTGALAVSSATLGHLIIASYDADPGFTGSTSTPLMQTVNKASTTTTLASDGPNPSFGEPVTLTATVTAATPGAGTPGGSVAFLDGVALLGTADINAAGQASFTTSGLQIGTHALTATYGGSASFEGSTSAPTSRAVNCPATLTMPFAIVGDEGQLISVGTIRGTETTTGSRCTVAYTLDFRGLSVGSGMFIADHPAVGVINISNGTFAVRGVTPRVSFAGTVNSNAGIAATTFTFASGAASRTVTIHYTLGAAGQWTSTIVTKS